MFQDEGQLYANFLFHMLIMERKFFAFQFLSRGICLCFPILTGINNGLFTNWKIGNTLLQNIPFEA